MKVTFTFTKLMLFIRRKLSSKCCRRPPPQTRSHSPSYIRVMEQPNQPLRSVEQTRKSQRMANRTSANGRRNRVTSSSQNCLFQEPKNAARTRGHRVTKMFPYVLILVASSMGPHPLFAQERKHYGNFLSTSFSMN
jgi:hypothetical protein